MEPSQSEPSQIQPLFQPSSANPPEKQEPTIFSFNKKQEEEKPNVFENKNTSSIFSKKEETPSLPKGPNSL